MNYRLQIGYQLPTDEIGCLCGGQPIEGFFSKIKKAVKKLDPKKRVKQLGKDIHEGSRKVEREFARNPELVGYAGMALSLVPGLQLAGAGLTTAARVRQARNASKDAAAYVDTLEADPTTTTVRTGSGAASAGNVLDWLNPADTQTRLLRWGIVAAIVYFLFLKRR